MEIEQHWKTYYDESNYFIWFNKHFQQDPQEAWKTNQDPFIMLRTLDFYASSNLYNRSAVMKCILEIIEPAFQFVNSGEDLIGEAIIVLEKFKGLNKEDFYTASKAVSRKLYKKYSEKEYVYIRDRELAMVNFSSLYSLRSLAGLFGFATSCHVVDTALQNYTNFIFESYGDDKENIKKLFVENALNVIKKHFPVFPELDNTIAFGSDTVTVKLGSQTFDLNRNDLYRLQELLKYT